MRTRPVPIHRQRQVRTVVQVLVVSALAGLGLPDGRAEIRNSGARVQMHRDRSDIPRIADLKQGSPVANPTSTALGPFATPDNDYYFLRSGADAASRSANPSRAAERSSSRNGTPRGLSPDGLPWNQVGFEEYDEQVVQTTSVKFVSPEKYSLEATLLPASSRAPGFSTAVLVAHLPDHAQLWVEGRPVTLKGSTSYFESPPLTAGKRYSYSVRTAWMEDGRWVSQDRKVPVQAGAVQALFLRPSLELLALRSKKALKVPGK